MTRAKPVAVSPKTAVEVAARRIVAVRVRELLKHAGALSAPEASAGQHDMRIAAKRLRYSLELFPKVFGASGEAVIAELTTMQDALGALHDLDVLLALVEDELRAIAAEEIAASRAGASVPRANRARAGLLSLLSRLTAMRDARHAATVARWDALIASGLANRLVALGAD